MARASSRAKKSVSNKKVPSPSNRLLEQSRRKVLLLERELQIERSLEKVRTRAMGMRKATDMLEICQVISAELSKLGVREIRNVQTAIFDTAGGTYMNYEYYPRHKKAIETKVGYTGKKIHKDQKEFASTMLKGDGAFYTIVFKGAKLKQWYNYQKGTEQLADRFLLKAHSLNYYWYSLGEVALGISTYYPLSDDELNLFQRFRNVFRLAYRRYLDIGEAVAQAREAQIELGLEKVRTRAMAMQSSDELKELIGTVFTELKKLDLVLTRCVIMIYDGMEKNSRWWMANSEDPNNPAGFFIKKHQHPPMAAYFRAWHQRKVKYIYTLEGKVKKDWDDFLFSETELKKLPGFVIEGMKAPERVYLNASFNNFGNLTLASLEPLSDAHFDILLRFAKVFDLTYTRFNDLQRVEAQARESQIELSLERVRARTMAMHRSDELADVVALLYKQFEELDFGLYQILISIGDPGNNMIEWWSRGFNETGTPQRYLIPIIDHPFANKQREEWLSGREFYAHILEGETKRSWEDYLFTQTELRNFPNKVKKQMRSLERVYLSDAFMKYGVLQAAGPAPLPADKAGILVRFAKVLDQAYTRMMDLQKAENQAREAQVEASLERVRSASMAMHTSDELANVIKVLTDQLAVLGFNFHTANFITNASMPDWDIWISSPGSNIPPKLFVPYFDHKLFNERNAAVSSGKEILKVALTQKEKRAFLEHFFEYSSAKDTDEERKKWVLDQTGMALTTIVTRSFSLSVVNYHGILYSDAENQVIRRLAHVFEQSYTRFLDLQKAELQAREAQIEAALERVRAKAMAMHKSEDLNAAVAVVFHELEKLNLGMLRVGISVLNKEKRCGNVWLTSIDEGGSVQVSGDESFDIHPLLHGAFEAWLKQEDFYYVLEGDDLTRYYQAVEDEKFGLPASQMLLSGAGLKQYCFVAVYNSGGLFAFCDTDFSGEAKNVMRRFANVFDLTYKRFLDLQKAEAQSREAHIQLALERVRARTMAMQHSDELAEASVVLFQQFAALGETPDRISIGIINEDRNTTDVWATNQAGTQINIHFVARNDEATTVKRIFDAWKNGKRSATVDLHGQSLKDWISYLRNELGMSIDDSYFHDRRLHQVSFFSQGWLNITTLEPLPAETLELLDRFAAVFNLTYTRFVDLKKAEAQTQKANIEVALERVRARALAMQEPEELKEVAQVMRSEMGILGVEELETSSIYIHGDSSSHVECWYALQDPRSREKKMLADHFMLNLDETWVGREMKKFFGSADKQTSIVMQGANRKEWIEYCYKKSPVFNGFYGEAIPDRTYHLYKFSHGYIGAASPGEISAESWDLLQRAASVFSLAYSRFRDLTQAHLDLLQLKEEKSRAETALSELQVTQKQLIQSEKMASLGELTAGIAHEIQNPLNFVNNFSEVSNELITEMLDEVVKGNVQEAKLLAEDVRQNLEKINFHGKRADEIVKGMLQHSRSSSGQKELTDVNALCDEYLRLAYHGLRAKDKSFNAKFKAELDPTLEKIEVVAQDIGRVILNLINNAFYAVSEKRKLSTIGFEPRVSVQTKKLSSGIEIRVIDNGNGIPDAIKEKIFQPFFTTKPTGQGTGLGLSLSYDIIKSHGGELKVETKEGEGTTFVIQLPAIEK